MLLGRDLQDGGDGQHVAIYCMANHLSYELVDEDDADVVAGQETPAEVRHTHNAIF